MGRIPFTGCKVGVSLDAYNPGCFKYFIQENSLEEQPPKPGLSRAAQLRILTLGAVIVALLLLVVPVMRAGLSAKPAPDLPTMISGGFRPSHDQWSNIPMGEVKARSFAGLVTAEANVAVNDETALQIFPPFTGQVMAVPVQVGSHVEKGALLMTVAATEAVQAQSDLIAASDTWHAAQVTARNADDNEKRQHALYTDGSVALKDWQQAQADQASGQAALRTANAALIAARGKLYIMGFGDRQISTLEASRKSDAISPVARVLAPISGTVTQRLVSPGQFIQTGSSSPAFAVGNFDRLWLVGNVREEDAPQVKVGDVVDVTVAVLPGHHFVARLTWVASVIDVTTHRLAVRAEMPNPDGVLKPAMFATMAIHTGSDRVSPAIPDIAIIHDGDSDHVWVSVGGDGLQLRAIKPGRSQNGFTEVLSGLSRGDRVVLGGSLFLDSSARAD